MLGKRKKTRQDPEKTLMDFPKYRNPMIINDHYYYQCIRCGCLVPEEETELHSSFHRTQDVLLEKLMIALEKFEVTDEATPR